MKLPTLYKKTSTGAIQFWEIWVAEFTSFSEIHTKYGQEDTDSPQYTVDQIKAGKNIGKKNETSHLQQALAEAQAKWEKQKKKGYVESIEAAEAGEVDDLIEGGIVPMLAQSYKKHSHKIKYPAYVQPKLDGIRCIAILKDGKCTLWSRTRKPITSMPHLVSFIENNFAGEIIFDGELFNPKFMTNFEHIVHLVRQEDPDPNCADVEYHIYDFISNQTFEDRTHQLDSMLFHSTKINGPLVEVETHKVDSEEQVMELFVQFTSQGFEGVMVRNAAGLYTNKRSYDLQKVKEMQDSEFEIVGIEEGRGKLSGHVGAFVCKAENGECFNAKMSGDTDMLKKYFENHSLWQNKQLTVQYQDLTSYGIPRFPVGKAIRDYE